MKPKMKVKPKFKLILIVLIGIAILAAGVALYFLFKQQIKNASKEPQLLYAIAGDSAHLLNEPTYAIADAKGGVFVADSGNHRVRVFDKKGNYKSDIGGPTSQKPLIYPYGIGMLDKDRIIVADTGAGALYEYTIQGEYVKTWLGADAKSQPAGVFVAQDRTVYVSDLANKQILVFTETGQLVKNIKPLQTQLEAPLGVAANQDGTVWVADGGNYNVKLLNNNNQVTNVFDGGPKNALSTAKGLAVDKQGRIYVADTMSNVVRVFDNQGNDLFSMGKDQQNTFLLPNGVSIDGDGKIYIADQGSNRIQVWGWKR